MEAPSIIIADNSPQIVAAGAPIGYTNWLCHKSKLTVSVNDVTLTGMTCTVAGTAPSQAFGNLRLYYSADSTFSVANSTLLSTLSNPGNGGTMTFPAFAQQFIANGTTGYLYITIDINSVVGNRSISIDALTPADFTFSLGGLKATGYASAAGLQTCCHVALSNDEPQVVPATVPAGTTVVLHQSALNEGSLPFSVSGLTCTTTGTYQTADITNLKVWYQSTPVFDGSGTLLSTYTAPTVAGAKTFPSFILQPLPTLTIIYMFITADIAPSATTGRTIGVNALTTSSFTITGADIKGSTTIGGLQTITAGVNVAERSQNLLQVYPNPVSDRLVISGLQMKNTILEIYNSLGEKVSAPQQQNGSSETTVTVSGLSSGIYFLRLSDEQNEWSGMFFKE